MTFSLEECADGTPHCTCFDAGDECCYCHEVPPPDDDGLEP